MENYAANSYLSKREAREEENDVPKKVVEKIVTNKVKIRKKSLLSRFTKSIIQGDVNSILLYIVDDVIVPAFKKSIHDTVDILLYGEIGKPKKGSSSRVAYNSIYDGREPRRETKIFPGYDFDEIVIETRGEAEEILSKMCEIIDAYGFTTVLDFYDMLDMTAPHTYNKYGWTDLKNASVYRVRDGYVIKFPRALPID